MYYVPYEGSKLERLDRPTASAVPAYAVTHRTAYIIHNLSSKVGRSNTGSTKEYENHKFPDGCDFLKREIVHYLSKY